MSTMEMMISDLPSVMNSMSVKQAILTPSAARILSPEYVPTLQKTMLVGEPLPLDVILKWSPSVQLLNVYGPTGTSMIVTTKHIISEADIGMIGVPFPTVTAFILKPEEDTLVPFGSEGELCIEGHRLVRDT
jgi:non-ribosomal peptide synthetase component F